MLLIDFFQGAFNLTLILLFIRFLQMKLNKDGDAAKALAYIYH